MFTNILVPTDFSGPSDAALEYARVLAAKFGATLHLLHVLEMSFVAGPLVGPFIDERPAVQARLFEDASIRLEHRARTANAEFPVRSEIVGGTGARAIVDYARERGMDLIVMGTHGRTGMAHLLMGSVAERVVRSASCPVLTVRDAPATASSLVETAVAAAV